MSQHDLRTYQRRSTTRSSGYHTCDNSTGGECIILPSQMVRVGGAITFHFHRDSLELVELFEKGISIIAFGGYIRPTKEAKASYSLSYEYEGSEYSTKRELSSINANEWKNIGFHEERSINKDATVQNVDVSLTVESVGDFNLEVISFDLGVIEKSEFLDTTCATSFYQKTSMHIPYLYYLDATLPIEKYSTDDYAFTEGRLVVLKSCNRCGRYLPINIEDEQKTLSFSLHCVKRAPCVHSTFRAYTIKNKSDLSKEDLAKIRIEDGKVISYFGHQLECKACKKFFVNAPLNPQRNPQQFKEDSLRRRAIEVLVNNLLKTNLIHFEFERKTKKEFSEYIWKKFNKRCFKCGDKSSQIELSEMNLDHTMPLAYLYRLDETATCLCNSHNSQKRDRFPVDYYSKEELIRLSDITGIPLSDLCKKEINQKVLDLLIKNVVWYFDVFLMDAEYQKVRDGIRTSDKINDSLKRVIAGKVDLAEEYKKKTGHNPTSVTIL